MKLRTTFTLAACLAIACSTPVLAQQFTENFTSPAKADGTIAGWTLPAAGYSVQAGKLAYDGTTDKQYAIWSATPAGTTITYTANITVTDVPGTDWSIAGMGIYADDENYWHLALVQSPDNDNKKHFVELSEMYKANWNANGATGTALTTNNDVPGFEWKTGVTYQFKMTLTPSQIQGQILEGGVVKFSCSDQLTATAVAKGRPMLDCGGMKANFGKLSANVSGL